MTFNSHLMNDVTTTRFRNERHKLRRHFESCLKLDLWHQMYWSLVPKQLLLSEPTVIFFFFFFWKQFQWSHTLWGLSISLYTPRQICLYDNKYNHSFIQWLHCKYQIYVWEALIHYPFLNLCQLLSRMVQSTENWRS